jgi:hypothetical protein
MNRRIALRVLLASIVVSAFLGIAAVLGGGGETMWKALATACTISGASVLIMVAFLAWDLPNAAVFTRVAVAAATLGAAMLVMGIWKEPRSDTYWQLTGTVVVLALATGHAAGLMLCRLAPQYLWVRGAALVVGLLLVALLLALLWKVSRGSSIATVLGVLAILEAALSLAVVALNIASRSIPPADTSDDVRFCPRCGRHLWLPAGEIICRHCGDVFVVELRPKLGELPNAVARERSAQ